MSVPQNQVTQRVRVRSFFVYAPAVFALAPAASTSGVVRIDAASDFYWIKSSYMADNAGAAQTESSLIVPNWDVQLQSGGSDKNLFNTPIPIPSVFGRGREPFVLPFPQRLVRNSELTITATSREAALTLNVRLAFIGWKDYGELSL